MAEFAIGRIKQVAFLNRPTANTAAGRKDRQIFVSNPNYF